MGCGFCATGQAGFTRHLTAGEIVEQVVRGRARGPRRWAGGVGNVVFMGMGEPLANEAAVWAAVERIHGDLGLSARHLTISTVGIVPGIRRLAARPLPVNLAVSLHAANDALRDELVPINRRYPIDDLLAACADYLARQGPPDQLRVGDDRRRQRPASRRRRAGRAVPAAAPAGPRQPDPAQPDAGLPDRRARRRDGCTSSATGWRRSASTPPCAATAAPTSTPPAASSRRRQPVARISSRRRAPYGYGLTGAPPPGWISKCRWGVPLALPVSPT